MGEEGVGTERARLSSLDALRGFAAVAVLIGHFTGCSSGNCGYDFVYTGYPQAWVGLSQIGPHAVELFFVISGFVILMTMGRVRSVGDFAYARFARLYPPYWGALVFSAGYILFAQYVLNAGMDEAMFSTRQFLANLTMVPNWLPGNHVSMDPAYWSLSVEMAFYVFMAALFALGLTKANRIVPTVLVCWGLFALFASARFVSMLSSGDRSLIPGEHPHYFLAGMALYLLYSGPDRPTREKWMLRIVIFSAPFFELTAFQASAAIVTLFIVSLAYFAVFRGLPFAETRLVQWLGRISYSLYLVHATAGFVTMKLLMDAGWNRNATVLVAFVQAFVLATVLHKLIEVPVTGWLRRRRRRTPQLSVTSN